LELKQTCHTFVVKKEEKNLIGLLTSNPIQQNQHPTYPRQHSWFFFAVSIHGFSCV
jgi:hypothetical protein